MKGITNCQSGGGGGNIYAHNISYYSNITTKRCAFTIYNDDSTPFTNSTIISWLITKGFNQNDITLLYPATGFFRESSSLTSQVFGVCATTGNIYFYYGISDSYDLNWTFEADNVETI